MNTDRAWMVDELRRTLGALALPGPAALATLPDGCVKADELALEYGHALEVALGNRALEFSEAQQQALTELDVLLRAMSGPRQAALWTDAAVEHDPRWLDVRERARSAQRLLGWSASNAAS